MTECDRYSGKCFGGPYDGRLTTHFAKHITIVMPEEHAAFADLSKESFEDASYQVGVYTFDEVEKVWQWQT